MRSLANPSWNHVEERELPKPRRVIKRKKPHYRGSKSGLIGVIKVKNNPKRPWRAYLRRHGQFISVGYFATKEAAAHAYRSTIQKLNEG